MLKLLIALSCALFFASGASAQTWQGCHVGVKTSVHAGQTTLELTGGPFSAELPSTSGALTGGQLGCDIQRGQFVFGGSLEGAAGNSSGFDTYPVGPGSVTIGLSYTKALSVSARAGVAVAPEWLVYGRLGYTAMNGTISATFSPGGPASSSSSGVVKGPFIGLGVEYLVRPNASLFAEVRQYKLRLASSVLGAPVSFENQTTSLVVGFNWRF